MDWCVNGDVCIQLIRQEYFIIVHTCKLVNHANIRRRLVQEVPVVHGFQDCQDIQDLPTKLRERERERERERGGWGEGGRGRERQ